MNPALALGTVLIAAAVVLLWFVLVGSNAPRVSRERLTGTERSKESILKACYRGFVRLVDKMMRSRGWQPFGALELELADVTVPPSQVVAGVVAGSGLGLAAGVILRQSLLLGLVVALMVPVGTKMWLKVRTAKRRRAFNNQLDNTLQMMASSLRSGQSFPQALDACARDAESPMSDELSRIVNENRIGRDIVDAMAETAKRMDCEDFVWLAEAVETTRETGGNLNEIIDRVAQTLRDRTEIREKVHAYSSEGRITSYILMALPIFVGVAYSFISPGYLNPLFTTGVGHVLLAGSAVMFVISYFWMRAIVQIKV